MENFPLVSVIITSYNRAHWIGQAIQSAIDQDYPNLEILILDNCSTDNSMDVIAPFAAFQNVKIHQHSTNIGMVANVKYGLDVAAKGVFATHVSSDDYLINKTFISQAIALIQKYDNVVQVFGKNAGDIDGNIIESDTDFMFEKEFLLGKMLFQEYFSNLHWGLGSGAWLFHREKVAKLNLVALYGLDAEWILKLFLLGNAAFIREPSYVYRTHKGRMAHSLTPTLKFNILASLVDVFNMATKYKELSFDFQKRFNHEIYGTMKSYIEHGEKENLKAYLLQVQEQYPVYLKESLKSTKLRTLLYLSKFPYPLSTWCFKLMKNGIQISNLVRNSNKIKIYK